ncbi:MAG: ferritin-like domain-containing protein [Gemmatimonadaceae bacterium]|nr:ferritin-like domain-containing protein [Gemmatimonadaceae bacterium]
MKLETMQDLLVDQLRDILGAERQALKALPKLERAAQHPELKQAFRDHRAETERQVERVGQALQALGLGARGKECRAMQALIEEGEEMLEAEGSDAVRDAALIIAAQRMEHYEISAYGSAIAHANLLGHDDVATLLEETLAEEKAADERLNALAESDVNESDVNATAAAEMDGDVEGDEEE